MCRLSRATLAAAVSPEPLASVLQNLVNAGLIEGFEERFSEVLVWGNLKALELAIEHFQHQDEVAPDAQEHVDHRAEYFRACRQFLHTASFRRLSQPNRRIFELHAQGLSQQAICLQLNVTPMKVRIAVKGARLAARLPVSTSSMPRGGGGGRPPNPPSVCTVTGCATQSRWAGLCYPHYQRDWRKRRAAGAKR